MAETDYFAYAIDARELPGVLPAPVMGCGIGICVGEACDFGAVDSVQSFARYERRRRHVFPCFSLC